jgi:hypothetical protein
MEPLEHGLVLASEVVGPGGGVMGAVGDQGEGQEAFAGAGVFGLEGQAAQVAERLSPFLHLDADHRRPSPGWPVHPKLLSFSKITRRTVLGNSWFLEDLGIVVFVKANFGSRWSSHDPHPRPLSLEELTDRHFF